MRRSSRLMMIMHKSLIILILVALQLLARDGSAVYLCVSSDWSYSIHLGSDACSPCEKKRGSDAQPCQASSSPICDCTSHNPSEGASDQSAPHVSSSVESSEPCGCTHFPVTIEIHQPRGLYRASTIVNVHRVLSLSLELPTDSFDHHGARQLSFLRSDAPAVDSFALTVLSTVVIRS